MHRSPHRIVALGLAAAALGFSAPVLALAKDGADDDSGTTTSTATSPTTTTPTTTTPGGGQAAARRAAGTCTRGSSAKLKVKPDDGRLETEWEVDQNRNGVRWSVSLRRNGKVVVSGTATTRGPSGSFSFERRLRNPAGVDRITARATRSGAEVCTATLRI